MKSSFVGLPAMALGIALGSFSPKMHIGRFYTAMYYQPTVDFTQSAVQDKSHWSTTPNWATCNGSNKACKVFVPDDYVFAGEFIWTITLEAEASTSAAALLDVKSNGVSINSLIFNRP